MPDITDRHLGNLIAFLRRGIQERTQKLEQHRNDADKAEVIQYSIDKSRESLAYYLQELTFRRELKFMQGFGKGFIMGPQAVTGNVGVLDTSDFMAIG